jgi:hypothetical protein
MANLELVTLNRTLAVNVNGSIYKVSSFCGKFSNWSSNKEDVVYQIFSIHFPDHVPAYLFNMEPVRLSFKRSAIVSTQNL